MQWIQTFTGRKFYPLDPRPVDIDIRDIAHALSLQCRFNGHCREFYCVADHCVHVSRLAGEGEVGLWGLLHDAAEAYLTDLPRPVKGQMPQFVKLEDRLLKIIMEHFGLGWPMPAAVSRADDVLLATEARDIMGVTEKAWGLTEEPLEMVIEPITPAEAERAFLDRFEALRIR